MRACCLCLLLAGCATQGSEFPVLEPGLADDARLGCAEIDAQVVKADVLRDAIFAESKQAIAFDTVDSMDEIIFEPITGTILGLGRIHGAKRRETGFQRAALAAEARVRVLLVLHELQGCPVSSSYAKGLRTPAEALKALREIDAEYAAGRLGASKAARLQSDVISALR